MLAELRSACPEVILSPTIAFTNPRNARVLNAGQEEYNIYSISDLHTPSVLLDTLNDALGATNDSMAAKRISRNDIEGLLGADILLVEDNPINTEVAKGMLEHLGVNVVCAVNGQEALSILEQKRFDLVLMDLQMPVMDGYEATREIRKNSHFESLPIVALTAHAMSGDHQRSLDAGMNDHITKPIDPDELMAALLKWIKPDNNRALKSITASDQATEIAEIPDLLPGLRYAEALARVSGDVNFYLSLWQHYDASYANLYTDLKELFKAGDQAGINAYAHSLKGVCANLGADRMMQIAGEIERLQTSDADTCASLLTQLQNAEEELMQSLQQVKAHAQGGSTAGDRSAADLPVLLTELKALLENGDTEALSYVAQLNQLSAGTTDGQLLSNIAQAIEDFEFELALQHLEKIVPVSH